VKYLVSLLVLLVGSTSWALEVPTLTRPVMDQAQVLSAADRSKLDQEIRQIWEQEKQVQISVLIVPTLAAENLEEYSIKVAEKWQLGTKKDGNGLLILIAMQEHKMRIEVGNGIEGVVTDSQSGHMIANMKPYMRNNDVYGALHSTIGDIHKLMQANTPEAIAQREADEKAAAEQKAAQDKIDAQNRAALMEKVAQGSVWLLIIVLFLVAGYNFFDSYVTIPKELKSLQDDKVRTQQKINTENANLSEQTNRLQGLKVDRVKQTYLRNQQSYQDLVGRKSQLTASIKTMKQYLGVK
jgi:uncharacterized membrane protein YgcG